MRKLLRHQFNIIILKLVLAQAGVFALGGCAQISALLPKPPPASGSTPEVVEHPPARAPAAADSGGAVALIDYAKSLLGKPYRYGGSDPQRGFDCSGYVKHVYQRFGQDLPHNAATMGRTLRSVAASGRQQGDLVFFNTLGRPFSHVGIYLGNEQFIHAPSSKSGQVMISNMRDTYWRKRFDGVRRVTTHNH